VSNRCLANCQTSLAAFSHMVVSPYTRMAMNSRPEPTEPNDDSSWADLDSIFDDEACWDQHTGSIGHAPPSEHEATMRAHRETVTGEHAGTFAYHSQGIINCSPQAEPMKETHGASKDDFLFSKFQPFPNEHLLEGPRSTVSNQVWGRHSSMIPEAPLKQLAVTSAFVASTASDSSSNILPYFQKLPKGDHVPPTLSALSHSANDDGRGLQELAVHNDAPVRALSAYNFFFRDERNRILNGGMEFTLEKQNELLREHWGKSRTEKRRHRKSHGKIDFTTLSRRISSQWKNLDAAGKAFYKRIATLDWHRFRKELEIQKSKLQLGDESKSEAMVYTTTKHKRGQDAAVNLGFEHVSPVFTLGRSIEK
jgi:hypothetical protein